MDKDIFALCQFNEPIAFGVIEPFDFPTDHRVCLLFVRYSEFYNHLCINRANSLQAGKNRKKFLFAL